MSDYLLGACHVRYAGMIFDPHVRRVHGGACIGGADTESRTLYVLSFDSVQRSLIVQYDQSDNWTPY